GRGWLFVTGYLLLQVGRSVFLIAALRGRALGEHFVNVLVWELLAGVLWVAGAIADADWAVHWLPGRGQRVGVGETAIAGGQLVEHLRLLYLVQLAVAELKDGT